MRIICFGVLVLGILLMRKIVWGYISRTTQYFLWIFPLIYLIFSPFLTISSKYSIENAVFLFWEKSEASNAINQYTTSPNPINNFQSVNQDMNTLENNISAGIEIKEKNTELKISHTSEAAENYFDKVNFQLVEKYWAYVRIGISGIMAIAVIVSNACFIGFCRKNRIFYLSTEEGLKVYMLEGIQSPFLLGRSIYIDMAKVENERVLRHIIIHESCHYKHRDNFWVLLRNVCLIFYWYNPFVWLANGYVKRDCELACDEAALSTLDVNEQKEYGYTLLSLVRYSTKKDWNAAISTITDNKMKKIKERISMIQGKKKYSRFITVMVMVGITILAGCAFTQKDVTLTNTSNETIIEDYHSSEEIENTAEKGNENENNKADHISSIYNGYYNISAKSDGKYTYVSSGNELYRMNNEGSKETLYDGRTTLGAIGENYLFFYSYPENMDEASIVSLDLSTGETMTALLLGENIVQYMEMYYKSDKLYVNKGEEIAVFKVRADGTLQSEKEQLSVGVPEELKNSEMAVSMISPIISMGEGYSEKFYRIRDKDAANYSAVCVYSDNSLVSRIENITDVMITQKGIIGRDTENYNDVYLWDVHTGEKRLLYASAENENKFFGYNTYDEMGVYGLLQDGDTAYFVCKIDWNGTLEKLFLVEGIEKGTDIQMSVLGNWIYFYEPKSNSVERRDVYEKTEL